MKNLFLLITFLLIGFQATVHSQTVAADNCEDAIELTDLDLFCDLYLAGNPTYDGGTSDCANPLDLPNLWFKFTAVGPEVTIGADMLSGAELVIALGSFIGGDCVSDNFEVSECSDEGLINYNGLTLGQEYFISLAFNPTDPNELIRFCIDNQENNPPSNDMPCGAIYVDADGGCESGTTVDATQDWTGICTPWSLYENSVYYKTTISPGNTRLIVTLTEITEASVMILDFDGDCEGQPFLFAYDCGESPLEAEAMVEVGKTYHIIVSTSNDNAGTFTLCLQEIPPPSGCSENEFCIDAEKISFVPITSDEDWICVAGCNIDATADISQGNCIPSDWRSVYFTFEGDSYSEIATITVASEDSNIGSISLAIMSDCGTILKCMQGVDGTVSLDGFKIKPITSYNLVVATPPEEAGRFDVCVKTFSIPDGFCVGAEESDTVTFTVVETSLGSPLEGPYFPGEEISFRYEVPNFDRGKLGSSQWIHGIVPVFGTGWDPASFDEHGMPVISVRPTGNATWGWYPDNYVTYKGKADYYTVYTDPLGQLGLCYFTDSQCSNEGINEGTGLPGGWFAYSVSPSCPANGNPNNGYGDSKYGPWIVTFTLKVRPSKGPESYVETGFTDCSVKMFTFGDKQTGCWHGGSENACAGDGYASINTVNISCDLPEISFIINRDEFTVEFINTSVDSLAYLWDFGDGNTSTEENPTHTYSGYGNYLVALTAENDCGSFTYEYELAIGGPVEAAFDASPEDICTPAIVDFINYSIGDNLEYLWVFEGGTPETSTDENPQIIYENHGTYDVSLIAYNESYADTLIYEDYITVSSPPIADFDYEISGDTVHFQETSLHANTFQWDFGNGSEAEGEKPIIVYANPGEYDVTLIAINNCGADTIIKKIEIITGVEEIPLDAIVIFPNPFNDVLNMKFSPELFGTVELNLMDISGKLLYSERFDLDNLVKRLVNLSGLNSGLYILEIKNNDRVAYRKLVK